MISADQLTITTRSAAQSLVPRRGRRHRPGFRIRGHGLMGIVLIVIEVDGLLDGSGLRLGGGGGGHGGLLGSGRTRAEAGEVSGEDTTSTGELLSSSNGSVHGKSIVISLVLW
jgi:hypothetical protein